MLFTIVMPVVTPRNIHFTLSKTHDYDSIQGADGSYRAIFAQITSERLWGSCKQTFVANYRTGTQREIDCPHNGLIWLVSGPAVREGMHVFRFTLAWQGFGILTRLTTPLHFPHLLHFFQDLTIVHRDGKEKRRQDRDRSNRCESGDINSKMPNS